MSSAYPKLDGATGDSQPVPNAVQPYPEERLDNLKKWNIGACVLHLVQAIFQLIAGLTVDNFKNFKLPAQENFLAYDEFTERLNLSSNQLGLVSIAPLISLFFFLSALFHFIVVSPWFNQMYKDQLNGGKNYFRWIEYSISSTLMIWLIAMLFGIYDIGSIFMICVLNATMNLLGLAMEKYNNIRDETSEISWFPFWLGCLTGFAPWVVIFQYVASAASDTTSELPDFVWGVLVGYLVFFQCFPINMILQYKRIGIWKDYLVGEKAYIILSLVAKTFLGWLVFGGLNQPNNYT